SEPRSPEPGPSSASSSGAVESPVSGPGRGCSSVMGNLLAAPKWAGARQWRGHRPPRTMGGASKEQSKPSSGPWSGSGGDASTAEPSSASSTADDGSGT